jgi:biopolymer transport protein ExbB/TolQ
VSQALLAPDIILLLVFIGYALFSIGSVIVEYFTVRKHFKVVMPKFLAALTDAKEEDIPRVIDESGLLNRQKDALNTVYEYRTLPGDALVALVRRLVSEEETRYDRITGRNNMAAKVAPMLGLMGTLIPLGPGIQALGQADTAALSSSLLVAFDTTVAGLVTAAVCLVVGKIRGNWYENYLSALDASMATMLEKIEGNRDASAAGQVQEPSNKDVNAPAQDQKRSTFDQLFPAVGQPISGQSEPVVEQPAIELPQPTLEQHLPVVDQSVSEPVQPAIEKLAFEQAQPVVEQPVFEQAQPVVGQTAFDQPQSAAEKQAFEEMQPATEQLQPVDEQPEPAFEQLSTSTQPITEPLETPAEAIAQDVPQLDFEPEPAEPAQSESHRRILFGARRSSEKGSSADSSSNQN